MNRDAIGAIGEIVGALAVVITLAYLAIQVQQNTRMMQREAHLDRLRAISGQDDTGNVDLSELPHVLGV